MKQQKNDKRAKAIRTITDIAFNILMGAFLIACVWILFIIAG